EYFDGYSDGFAEWFRSRAHAHGLSARAAVALHDDFVAFAREQGEAASRDLAFAAEDQRRALEAEFGSRLPAVLERARRAAREFAGEEALETLEARIGGPALIRMFD